MNEKFYIPKNRAKIIATLGPASEDAQILKSLVKEGATLFRINLSHAGEQQVLQYTSLIRKIATEMNQPIGIIADLPGPKIRIHNLLQEFQINKGDRITICGSNIQCFDREHEKVLELNYPEVIEDLSVGDAIYIDDGQIRFRVIDKNNRFLVCESINAGIIRPNKGMNFPNSHIRIEFPTDVDVAWIEFLTKNNCCDYIALSYVRSVGDIERIREMIRRGSQNIGIISKIEKHEAIQNMDSVIQASDIVMVARGDLGIEMPIEDIPHIQKSIIHKCNVLGKPVITATQMLESMIFSQTPTRAEAADIANAILDGTDALMLSAETAIAVDPVLVVKTMRRIIEKSESMVDTQKNWRDLSSTVQNDVSDAIAFSAARTANFIKASCIICLTSSGSTARRIAKYRPDVPIFVLTDDPIVLNLSELFWGTKPILIPVTENVQESIQIATDFLFSRHLIKKGDRVVITLGIPMGVAGSTNLIEVVTI
jgi:pyruvate kinase